MSNSTSSHLRNPLEYAGLELTAVNQAVREMYGEEAARVLALHDFSSIKKWPELVILRTLSSYATTIHSHNNRAANEEFFKIQNFG